MATDPRHVSESRDGEIAVLYAKRTASDLADAYPILVDSSGNLKVASSSGISNGVAGGKSVTNTGAGVAIDSDTSCSYVDISASGGILAIGDSAGTTKSDPANASGIILTPGSTVYRVYCSNLNEVFVSGATNTRASYIYFT